MNIKDGDIITLADGTEAIVNLTKIERVKELIPGRKYRLKHTGEFCHLYDTSINSGDKEIEDYDFYYVGKINISHGERYIFYAEYSVYCMFGTKSLDFVIQEIK